MRNNGLVYRPPYEADSFLLQVTQGCSHNRCSFCTMYRDVPFEIEDMDEIEKDIKAVIPYRGRFHRVFLENGDPFCLNADRLVEIANKIHFYLPEVDSITMYASVKNLLSKTDEELISLKRAGIEDLNIGVESGLDDALKMMDKGYTAEDARRELRRLKDIGIDYSANIIFGCIPGRSIEHMDATVKLLNETKPYLIFHGTIHAERGCPLYDDMKSGKFVECTVGEYIEEQEYFLNHIDLEGCYLFGLHPSNIIKVSGILNGDKPRILKEFNEQKLQFQGVLDKRPHRMGEGAITYI